MERVYKQAHTIRALRSGTLGPYLQRFAENSIQHGYPRKSIQVQLQTLAHFGRWLQRCSIPLRNVRHIDIQRYLSHNEKVKKGDARTLQRFLDLLAEQSVTAMPVIPKKSKIEAVADDFAVYLQHERGLALRTIKYYRAFVARFLAWRFGKNGGNHFNLALIEGGELATFVQQEAAKRSASSTRMITASLHSFVRWLLLRGVLDTDISGAIPKVRCCSLSGIPRFLTASQVKHVLASCDRRTATGRRDYAILLLLSRLGLRACEVATLDLESMDWVAGTLTVHGKGSKICKLPLPHDVGEAIAAYLRRDRPMAPSRRLFLCIFAPHRGFAGPQGVCQIVRGALARAGVQSPSKGAHQFRHALATRMLEKGASLTDIGQVMRHVRPKTTFLYTKVDLRALRVLARRWPGGAK